MSQDRNRIKRKVRVQGAVDAGLAGLQSSGADLVTETTGALRPISRALSPFKRTEMRDGMKWLYLMTVREAAAAFKAGPVDAGDLRNYATTLAICIDKVELLEGRPTERIGGEMFHVFPQLAERLARVARALPVVAEESTPQPVVLDVGHGPRSLGAEPSSGNDIAQLGDGTPIAPAHATVVPSHPGPHSGSPAGR